MRSRLVWLLAMVGVAALVGVLVPSAGAQRRAGGFPSSSLAQSCYPDNAFPIYLGNFRVFASGVGKGDLEIENTGTPADGVIQGVTGQLIFTGDVHENTQGSQFVPDGGHMNGDLHLTLRWPSWTGFRPTTFRQDCIAELQTDPADGPPGSFEAELEGWVSNFPGVTGTQRAIASVHEEFDPEAGPNGSLTYGVSIELGTTCSEPGFPAETEIGGTIGADTGLDGGRLNISPSGTTAGRGALPTGVTPTWDPGAPCDGSVSF